MTPASAQPCRVRGEPLETCHETIAPHAFAWYVPKIFLHVII
jgi:hypothetical protein